MRGLTDHYQNMYPLARWAAMSDDQFYCTTWVKEKGMVHLAFGFIPLVWAIVILFLGIFYFVMTRW